MGTQTSWLAKQVSVRLRLAMCYPLAEDELQYAEEPQHKKKQKQKKQPKNMPPQLGSPPKPADPRQASRSLSSHCINKAHPIAKPVDPPIGLGIVMDGCMSPITPETEVDMCLSPVTPEPEVDMCPSPITPDDEVVRGVVT